MDGVFLHGTPVHPRNEYCNWPIAITVYLSLKVMFSVMPVILLRGGVPCDCCPWYSRTNHTGLPPLALDLPPALDLTVQRPLAMFNADLTVKDPTDMFKVVHCEACTDGKRTVAILLESFLVYVISTCISYAVHAGCSRRDFSGEPQNKLFPQISSI